MNPTTRASRRRGGKPLIRTGENPDSAAGISPTPPAGRSRRLAAFMSEATWAGRRSDYVVVGRATLGGALRERARRARPSARKNVARPEGLEPPTTGFEADPVDSRK